MDFSPDDPNMMAAGSYSSVAAVYDLASGSAALVLSGHKGGLTQVCSVSAKPVAVDTILTVIRCHAHGTGHPSYKEANGYDQNCTCVVIMCEVRLYACCLSSA